MTRHVTLYDVIFYQWKVDILLNTTKVFCLFSLNTEKLNTYGWSQNAKIDEAVNSRKQEQKTLHHEKIMWWELQVYQFEYTVAYYGITVKIAS